jgi:hypothetical protein
MRHAISDPNRRPGRPRLRLVDGDRADSGRHALDEEALLTPIFATLARRRGRPAPVDPVERFRRDPLTAPLPVVVPARRQPGAHARVEPLPERPGPGRHALRRGPSWLPH